MGNETPSSIGVEGVLELSGASREAKAYAFLYAAFKRTEVSSNPVRDALDCLTPFISPYLNSIAGKQVPIDGVQSALKAFGFEIPIYAIEQLMPALKTAGYVEYNTQVRAYVARKHDSQFDVVKSEIEIDFDEVVSRLAEYAKEVGFNVTPPSGNWGNALVAFLKTSTDRPPTKVANVKGALVEPGKAETAVVGAFIVRLHETSSATFDKLVNIFMGVLVEEFISSMSEIGGMHATSPVHALYDTAVLLRLLGCSGKLLRTATEELTNYLQDLNFKIHYFSGNEAEVANILDTIVHLKDTGKELEGETAEAISSGEVSITHIRALKNAFPERLALRNVFSAETLEKSAIANAKFQIDEKAFSEYLKQKALAKGRVYGAQNREHDAQYLGTIMRLRAGTKARDLANCGYVFITTNKFLAQMSRRFLIEQKAVSPQHCPAILSVGQMATIAWLLKDKKLEPEKAGRELLSNCFAAVRPDHEWFKFFREGFEQAAGNLEEYGKDPNNAITLHAARRIAQDESFGESAVVRELNMVEILQRAEKVSKALLEEKDAVIATTQAEADLERQRAVEIAVEETKLAEQNARHMRRMSLAEIWADKTIGIFKIVIVILFVILSVMSFYLQSEAHPSITLWVVTGILGLINIVSIMDLLKMGIAERFFAMIRRSLQEKFAWVLTAIEKPEALQQSEPKEPRAF